jgi:hypothetical protein
MSIRHQRNRMNLSLARPGRDIVSRASAALLLLNAVTFNARRRRRLGDGWNAFIDKVGSTTPFPLGTEKARAEGFWHGLWDGTKRIWSEGSQDLYLSGYYYHAPYAYSSEKRDEFNDRAWGVGYGRTLTEDNDNQRCCWGSSRAIPTGSPCTSPATCGSRAGTWATTSASAPATRRC